MHIAIIYHQSSITLCFCILVNLQYYDTSDQEPGTYQDREREQRLYQDRDAVSPGAPTNRPPIILAKPGPAEKVVNHSGEPWSGQG